MEEREIRVKIPNDYEIDKENSTFECIKFKPIKKELPKTWEEFCETHPRRAKEAWLTEFGSIHQITTTEGTFRNYISDKTLLPNIRYAEAMLALCQLIQLRDCYNDGWIPDWSDDQFKYTIYNKSNRIQKYLAVNLQRVLAFKSVKLCDEFFENFRDLIEIAKPLL